MAKPVKTSGSGGSGGSGKKSGGTKGVTLNGTEGADTLFGGAGNDTLYGNGGNDSLYGYDGNDYLVGGDGDDFLDGGSNYDQMDGGAGNDTYVVDHASDFIVERYDGGIDTVLSSISYTIMNSEIENLTLIGDGAIDGVGTFVDNRLTGNSASNRLDGREGNDVIDGKGGADVLIGGSGADTFAFTTAIGGGNVDQILDFEAGIDRIALDGSVFGGLAAGALDPSVFAIGSSAADADDRIVYDPATGILSFDADGIGGAEAIAFATLQPGLDLSAASFIVI